jgi:hypothetical protein
MMLDDEASGKLAQIVRLLNATTSTGSKEVKQSANESSQEKDVSTTVVVNLSPTIEGGLHATTLLKQRMM